jgi:primosomal protein N' (replication factor Y)
MQEVATHFPTARLLEMSSDTITTAKAGQEAVKQITDGEVDIIIGTQMIAKGHHFPHLTLVGVVDADVGLSGTDLRAAERTYQLLHQVSGRAGREEAPGMVMIQTYQPDSTVMQALASGERDAFYAAERASRQRHAMPPFVRMAGIILSDKNENAVKEAAILWRKSLQPPANVEVLGPVPAPLYKLRNQYRFRLLIRAPRNVALHRWLKDAMERIQKISRVTVRIDMDPQSFM